MNNILQTDPGVMARLEKLRQKREEILRLDPEQALKRITDDSQPYPLVHSFSEEDFYFLIHDIGIDDALPVLAMASDRQWTFLLDAEAWEKDRLDLPELTRWFHLLMKADPNRLIRWSTGEHLNLLELYLFKNIELAIREHDQDPSELGTGFSTDNDVFYIRLKEPDTASAPQSDDDSANEESVSDEVKKDERELFLDEFLKRLSADDHVVYQRILLESGSVIPSEVEEECYRLRNVRRAEKGFLPFEEAVGVYQPLTPDAVGILGRKRLSAADGPAGYTITPFSAVQSIEGGGVFIEALAVIDAPNVLFSLQAEFAGLCNQVIAADKRKVRERESLREVVRKVCGYVNMGLSVLSEKENADIPAAAALLKEYPLIQIFRVGYGQVAALKRRAEKWHDTSWAASEGIPLTFWGEEWVGVIGGLLIRRPQYFDNYETGRLYRDFGSLDDINKTGQIIDQITAVDYLLSLMRLPSRFSDADQLVIWKNYLLTLWARHCIGLPETVAPIAVKQFRPFYKNFWEETERAEKKRPISELTRTAFLQWVSEKSMLPVSEVKDAAGSVFDNLWTAVEKEYQGVDENALDPRYVHFFLLETSAVDNTESQE